MSPKFLGTASIHSSWFGAWIQTTYGSTFSSGACGESIFSSWRQRGPSSGRGRTWEGPRRFDSRTIDRKTAAVRVTSAWFSARSERWYEPVSSNFITEPAWRHVNGGWYRVSDREFVRDEVLWHHTRKSQLQAGGPIAARAVVDFLPIVGPLVMLAEAAFGEELFTGREVDRGAHALIALASLGLDLSGVGLFDGAATTSARQLSAKELGRLRRSLERLDETQRATLREIRARARRHEALPAELQAKGAKILTEVNDAVYLAAKIERRAVRSMPTAPAAGAVEALGPYKHAGGLMDKDGALRRAIEAKVTVRDYHKTTDSVIAQYGSVEAFRAAKIDQLFEGYSGRFGPPQAEVVEHLASGRIKKIELNLEGMSTGGAAKHRDAGPR